MAVVLHCNDGELRTSAPAGTPLLEVLREQAGLTAAKPGCGTGDCGACLVLLGARAAPGATPVYELHHACLTTVAMAEGGHVVTAEGLVGEELGPVQRALLHAGAVQCGYCTAGLVVGLTWALLAGVEPRRAALGNLCRCTGYGGIRRACDVLASHGAWSLGELLPAGTRAVAARLPVRAPQHLSLDERRWVAGGTDEIPEHRHQLVAHRRPTLLRRVPDLGGIAGEPRGLRLGAAVTVAEIQGSALVERRWPGLAEHLDRFGSPAVRAAATLGGNLVHASPTADLAIPLLAMGAVVVLAGPHGTREVPLDRFHVGYHRTERRRDEVLVAVRIPDPPAGAVLHLEKVAKRPHDDIASVSLAMRAVAVPERRLAAVRVAAGGVAPTPLLLVRTAAALEGAAGEVDRARVALGVLGAEIAPIDDLRGSAAYKRALLGHLLLAALDRWHPGVATAVLLDGAVAPGGVRPGVPVPGREQVPVGDGIRCGEGVRPR
ncbi:MAG: FAD binding domain-containing protein [Candidatus Nanopelagicales bacterium]|jgi:xanthine dehydrogenase small subunit|nr:FAD binding domain-containing protein [Candidatus Nanopelagicales bacterium]